jgi:hypothetical protein
VYALKNAKDISALKAISQNLMHKNLSITDGVYGVLSDKDVRNKIVYLGKDIDLKTVTESDELVTLLRSLLMKIEEDRREK